MTPLSALAGRSPFQRPQPRLRDLASRHLPRDGIANPLPRLARPGRRSRRRKIEPLAGLDDIARHTLATVIEQPERILREAIALLGRAAIPHRRFRVVLRHAAPGLEQKSEISLRGRGAALGQGNEDLRSALIVLAVECGNALAEGLGLSGQRGQKQENK